MKISTVVKIITLLLLLTFLGMFIFENLDPVPIWIPLFKGRHCGLIFIILAAYLAGASNSVWVMTHISARIKKKQKMRELMDENAELFEDEV